MVKPRNIIGFFNDLRRIRANNKQSCSYAYINVFFSGSLTILANAKSDNFKVSFSALFHHLIYIRHTSHGNAAMSLWSFYI